MKSNFLSILPYSFYKEYKDNNVVSDKEIELIGNNASYNKTLLDKRKKLNYIKYLNIGMLSRVEQHLDDHIYDSQFINEFWKEIDAINHVSIDCEKLLVNDDARDILLTAKLDWLFYNTTYEKFRSYDHSFKGIEKSDNFKLFKIDKNMSTIIYNLSTIF